VNGLRVALVGATGAVGQVCLRILEERAFPAASIRVCASEPSWGKKLRVNGQELTVEEATPELLGEVDLVFIAAGSDISRELAPIAVERGAMVIDKSAAFRMDPAVPLVVPEVNAGDLDGHRGIVSTPNCSTTPLVMALKPLDAVNRVVRVTVATYQAVSGTGAAAEEELRVQSGQVLGGDEAQPEVYPHQIAFNVIPFVDGFLVNGYTVEEWKLVTETRKIMHLPDLPVSATCVRVPVYLSHSESVNVEFTHPITPQEAREILSRAPGVEVVDEPGRQRYPLPLDATGRDQVFVGRIREGLPHTNSLAMWVVADDLRKGAALNAVQIAEELLKRDLLSATGRRV
jgi:aspartate-semialdehyde dehydrogenase